MAGFNLTVEPAIKFWRPMKVAIIGYGKVGRAYHKVFSDALIYDPHIREPEIVQGHVRDKAEVNACDIALVCVPTDLIEVEMTNGATSYTQSRGLDMSIVEEVVGWLETPLILIKSALMPGTVDRLVKETGKKIAVSVEFVGEGSYPVHFWKYPHQDDPRFHQMLIIGGEEETATACAEVMWDKLSPDVAIHLVSAKEAEITKLIENFYGALKVTFINSLKSLADKSDTNFIKIHQAWQSDPRTDSMHLRTVSFKRGWQSKCWDKDVVALASYAESIGAEDMALLVSQIIKLNAMHLSLNEE